MLIDFKDKQYNVYNIMVKEIENRHISHAYLIDENNCNYAFDMVFAFVKEILSFGLDNVQKEILIKRIDDGNYPEIKIISPDGMIIRKRQLLNLQFEFSTVALEGNKRIYIIKDADKMRGEAANSMLKFLEEPQSDVVAILLTNNYNSMLPTIISRCQILRFGASNDCRQCDELDEIAVDFIENLEDNSSATMVNLQTILYDKISNKDREKIVTFFDKLVDIYYDMLNINIGSGQVVYTSQVEILTKIANKNGKNKLLSKIDELINCKDCIKNNVNIGLLIDSLIIKWRKI